MREKPWQVIDLLTNETIGWYAEDWQAHYENRGKAISVLYRPGRKKKVKK